MSGYPPPPNQQRFAPPPPPPGQRPGGFVPPPPPPPGGGSGNFAPPPPPGGGGFVPPSQPQRVGGFAPPPPQPPAAMQNINQGMSNLSMQQQSRPPQPGMGFTPPPPGGMVSAGAPPGNRMMMAPPQPPGAGVGFMPPAAPKPPGVGNFGPPPPPAGTGPPPHMSNVATFNSNMNKNMNDPNSNMSNGGPMMTPAVQSFYPQAQSSVPPMSPMSPMVPGNVPPGQQQQQQQLMPGVAAGVVGGGMPVPNSGMNENIDYNVVIPSNLCRWTAGKLPTTAALANATKIPLGAVLRPLAPVEDESNNGDATAAESSIPTVQPGTAGIVRCKRCRTYINAFVTWSEHGRRWRCNICAQINDCPSAYFCHLDELGLRRDRFERPELSHSVVEFVAPAEYMVRPPQEPTYFFVIDTSATAVRSGMLASTAAGIKASLDELPGGGRTKVGFITFDNAVHYYNLAPELSNPQMLVVSDLKELFVPLPDHLLVNLHESRSVVEALLDNLPLMFVKSPVVSQSCLGPALKAAFTIMKQIGGKMSVFQSILPNLGDGSLKPRDQPGLVGTPNEHKVLKPESTWYKDTAIEFSRQQISVDLYIFPYQYMDLATLGELAKYTSGTMMSYVNFNAGKDGPRFEAQLHKSLTQTTAFEAVMRIRCTKGMRITNFYGNFYIRGTDLLALPNCNPDSVFGFDLAYDDQNLSTSHVTVQAALLYTSSFGERRIRVLTQALPVTSLTSELIASIDTDTCTTLLSKQALDVIAKSNSLDNARLRLQQVCVDIIKAAKGGDRRTVSGYSVPPGGMIGGASDADEKPIPENLQLLPLYTLAMMKNVAFRGGTDVHPDERIQSHYFLNGMWVDAAKKFVYPRLFGLHNMEPNDGHSVGVDVDDPDTDRVAGRNRIRLPKAVNLSVDRLSINGVYLLDNGVEMYLWVGRMADMNIMTSLFGVHTLDDIDLQQIAVSTTGDAFASRFGAITQALRESESEPYFIPPKFNIVREGDAHMEARFFWFMIEDRAAFQGGTHNYTEFMQFVNNPQASAGPSVRGPGPAGVVPPGGAMPPNRPPGAMPPQGMPPQKAGMGMPPPQQPPHGMGVPSTAYQQQGLGAPQQQGMGVPQQHGMGMAPPNQQPPGMGMMSSQPGQQQGIGMPPMNRGVPPSPPQQNVGALSSPANNRYQPPGPPGRANPGPPQSNFAPSGPPTPGMPQRVAPPAMPPQSVDRGPPGSLSIPPPPPAAGTAGLSGPPPPQRTSAPSMPPPQQRPAAPPLPQRSAMPPPPPPARSGMPLPPPPR